MHILSIDQRSPDNWQLLPLAVFFSLKVHLFCAGMKWERCSSSPKLIGDTSNSCYPAAPSLGTSHCLAFIDIYGVMLSGRGARDSSLSSAALGLFAAVHKAIMYLSPAAICHTLPRLSLCSLYNTAKSVTYQVASQLSMAQPTPYMEPDHTHVVLVVWPVAWWISFTRMKPGQTSGLCFIGAALEGALLPLSWCVSP